MSIQGRVLICGDFNAHHQWWNSERASGQVNCNALVPWLQRNRLELINTPDVFTFHRQNTRPSVIDLAFATAEMYEEIRD